MKKYYNQIADIYFFKRISYDTRSFKRINKKPPLCFS